MVLRKLLFKGFTGCSDGNCVITGPATGMHTNGGCKCLMNLSRGQLSILSSRLRAFGEYQVAGTEELDKLFPATQ